MSGKNPRLTPLAARKQLLVVESELNRAGLAQDWRAVKNEFERLKKHALQAGLIASSATILTGLFSLFRHRKKNQTENQTAPAGKISWVSRFFKGAHTGASVWLALRSFLR